MNPEDQLSSDGTPQGAPSVSSDAEYDNVAAQMASDRKKKQEQDRVNAPTPAEPDGFGKKVSSFFDTILPDRHTPEKYGKAVARGVVNAGREMASTLNAVSAASQQKKDPNFIEHWYNTPIIDSTPMTDGEVEGMLGKRQEGMAGFVESVSQFTTGMLAAGEILKPLQLGALAGRTIAGAASDMTAFDPHQGRLSDVIQNSPFSNELTGLLTSDKNDNELTARLKAGTEGLITGYTLDKLIGGVKALRALKGAKTEEEKAAAVALADVKHNPAAHGPVVVKDTPDGKFMLSDSGVTSRQDLSGLDLPIGKEGVAFEPYSADTKILKVVSRGADGKPNGVLILQKTGDTTADAFIVVVNPDSRRKGIATALYNTAEAEGFTVRSGQSGFSIPDGQAFMTARQGFPAVPAMQTTADKFVSDFEALSSPIYDTAAGAESAGASINQAYLNAAQPLGSLSDSQVSMLAQHASDLTAEGIPTWIHPDFNFNYVASPIEVKATVQAISEKLPALKEVQTHAQTVAMAEGLFDGKTGEQVVNMLRDKNSGVKDFPQWIQAARTYLYSSASKVSTLAQAADAMPNNAIAFGELKKAMTHLYDIHESVAGLSKTAGRALDVHKIIVGSESSADEAARASMEHLTLAAQKEALNAMDKSEILATARLLRMSEGDPKEVLDLMRGQAILSQGKKTLKGWSKVVDNVNGLRMEAMLAGPRTHVINTVSNAITAAQMPVEMWWGGVITSNRAMARQGADQLVGLFMESREAWRAAGKAFRTGTNVLDEAGAIVRDAAVNGKNPLNGLAQAAHLPSRMLMTSDEFFKTLNYRSSVRAQSLRLARQDGITDATQLAGRLAEDMKAAFNMQGAATNPKALAWARTATFQNPLEYGYGKSWQNIIKEHPEFRLITPFVRTPVNLFRYAWQRTPVLGAFQRQMRADIMAGGERRALALSKQSMGVAAWTGAALLAQNKIITGGGPKDPKLRSQWLAAGNQPYSVKLPSGGWVSFARANPTFNALGIVADLYQMSGELPEGKHEELAAAFAASIANNITNQTFMQGLSDALDAFSNGDEQQMMRLFTNTGASFVPNLSRQMNPDDTLRETRGMVDEIAARVPGWSTTLEPRRNIFGEPIMKAPGYINQSLNPFTYMADPGDNDVQQELLQLGKAMSMPSPTRGKLDLTDRTTYAEGKSKQSPYDRWLELMSKSGARSELTKKVNSPEWAHYSDGNETYPGGRKFQEASQVLSKHQDRAWRQVLDEYPKLKLAINGERRDRASTFKNVASAETPQFISQ